MSRERIRSTVVVAPLTLALVPDRVSLMEDNDVMRNLVDEARSVPLSTRIATMTEIVSSPRQDRLEFSLTSKKGHVVGYSWLEDLNYQSRTAELSIAIKPKFRFGMGGLCFLAMLDTCFNELNLEYLYTRIQAGNALMVSGDAKSDKATLIQPDGMFSAGVSKEWLCWNEARQDCPLWVFHDRH